MIKERIKNTLELEKKQIAESEHLSQDEKLQLTELVSEAAECTNGYEEPEKVQRVAETTFHVTTAMVKVMEQLAENNDLTKQLDQTVKNIDRKESLRDTQVIKINDDLAKIGRSVGRISVAVENRVKRDIRDLGWKDTLKLIAVKPWVWIFLVFFVFSPKCIELVQILIKKFGGG